MANNNDTIGKTLFVVIALCLVCSVVVAGSAVGLKAKQEQERLLDKQRNVLEVSGLLTSPTMSGDDIRAVYESQIEARLVDLKSGTFADTDPASFDPERALKDPEQSIVLPSREDPAGLRRRANLAEVYLVRDKGSEDIRQIILPVNGNGLWSMMYAFVSVEVDGNTVVGVNYYDQGETPGLGDEVTNPGWRSQWKGKELYNAAGQPAIYVVKGRAPQGDTHAIDGISGATLTSRGVENTFRFWSGDLGYGPFLRNIREGLLTQGAQNHG